MPTTGLPGPHCPLRWRPSGSSGPARARATRCGAAPPATAPRRGAELLHGAMPLIGLEGVAMALPPAMRAAALLHTFVVLDTGSEVHGQQAGQGTRPCPTLDGRPPSTSATERPPDSACALLKSQPSCILPPCPAAPARPGSTTSFPWRRPRPPLLPRCSPAAPCEALRAGGGWQAARERGCRKRPRSGDAGAAARRGAARHGRHGTARRARPGRAGHRRQLRPALQAPPRPVLHAGCGAAPASTPPPPGAWRACLLATPSRSPRTSQSA
jgi:hypothetical protein